jgi:hypothetical protein
MTYPPKNADGSRGRIVRWYPAAPRWPYIIIAFVVFLLGSHAFEDTGLQSIASLPFLFVIVLCIVQAIWPTFIIWALLMVPFIIFMILVFVYVSEIEAWTEYILWTFVPILFLWIGRPWRKKRSLFKDRKKQELEDGDFKQENIT